MEIFLKLYSTSFLNFVSISRHDFQMLPLLQQMFLSLHQPVTKNRSTKSKCYPKFLLLSKFEIRRGCLFFFLFSNCNSDKNFFDDIWCLVVFNFRLMQRKKQQSISLFGIKLCQRLQKKIRSNVYAQNHEEYFVKKRGSVWFSPIISEEYEKRKRSLGYGPASGYVFCTQNSGKYIVSVLLYLCLRINFLSDQANPLCEMIMQEECSRKHI